MQIKYKGLDFSQRTGGVEKEEKPFYVQRQCGDRLREGGFQHASVPEAAGCRFPADSDKPVCRCVM